MIQIGDIVSLKNGQTYGQVIKIWTDWKQEKWGKYRIIDASSGELMICPDLPRCRPDEGCVICTINRPLKDFNKWNEIDIKYYKEEGMLTEKIYSKAMKNISG